MSYVTQTFIRIQNISQKQQTETHTQLTNHLNQILHSKKEPFIRINPNEEFFQYNSENNLILTQGEYTYQYVNETIAEYKTQHPNHPELLITTFGEELGHLESKIHHQNNIIIPTNEILYILID